MPTRLPLFALLLIASCGGGTTPDPKPKTTEELRADYISHMDLAEEESNQILEDLKANRDVRPRLTKIRELLRKSQAIRYRNAEETADMDTYFETFYMKLDQLDQAEWNAENGGRLWDKLQFQCSVCHGRYRDE